jgi:hypothetical protein
MEGLERVDLQYNKIKNLPQDIEKLQGLRWLNLLRNPIGADEKARIKAALPDCHVIF